MSRLRNAFLTVPEAAYIAGVSPAGHVALAEDAGFHHVLVLAGLGVIAEIRIILVGQLANYDRSVGAGILDDLADRRLDSHRQPHSMNHSPIPAIRLH